MRVALPSMDVEGETISEQSGTNFAWEWWAVVRVGSKAMHRIIAALAGVPIRWAVKVEKSKVGSRFEIGGWGYPKCVGVAQP